MLVAKKELLNPLEDKKSRTGFSIAQKEKNILKALREAKNDKTSEIAEIIEKFKMPLGGAQEKGARLAQLKALYNSVNYEGNIYIIGYGAIGRALLYMLYKIINISPGAVFLIERKNIEEIKAEMLATIGHIRTNIINKEVKKANYLEIFKSVKTGDLIIDCSVNISTEDILILVQGRGASYLNSSVETWDYTQDKDPFNYSLFYKLSRLTKYSKSLGENVKFNALIGMGMNPGMISIWAKLGLDEIKNYYIKKGVIIRATGASEHYGKLAEQLGLQTIHISEMDTQRVNLPKRRNEYCNTWSSNCEAFYEEAIAPVEFTYGTHEEQKKKHIIDAIKYVEADRYLILDRLCLETKARSYCGISGNYIGSLIRHEENYTIGNEFSIMEGGKKIYCPSVYYIYHPCNETLMSLYELRERNYKYQDSCRLLTSEIIDGRDELGPTYFMKDGNIFWLGSLLGIEEAREIYSYNTPKPAAESSGGSSNNSVSNNYDNNYINATIAQVIGGYIAGIIHLINMIKKEEYVGVIYPEAPPHREIYEKMKPFYGEFIFRKIEDWENPLPNKENKFSTARMSIPTGPSTWQLNEFLL